MSDHYVPTEFSGNFFKQFDLAMKLKREELKKQGKSSKQVNEITESNLIQAFGVTEDQMEKAASLLNGSEITKKLGNSSAWLAKSTDGEEVSNSTVGKIPTITLIHVLILVIIVVTTTNNNNSDLKKLDKPNSGHHDQKTAKLH